MRFGQTHQHDPDGGILTGRQARFRSVVRNFGEELWLVVERGVMRETHNLEITRRRGIVSSSQRRWEVVDDVASVIYRVCPESGFRNDEPRDANRVRTG